MDFSGKAALITGGAQGIGRAYANALLGLGMKVCITDLLEDKAKEFIESLPPNHKNNVIFQKCDVSSLTDFKNAFDRVISEFGRIDMLINNAGVFNEQLYMKCIEVNFIAVVQGTRLAFEHMSTANGGHGGFIINTSSEAGLDPMHLAPVYVATKHAVVGFTRSYGSEYHFKKTGIKVNAICPGPVDTGFFEAFPRGCVDVEEAKKLAAGMKPVKFAYSTVPVIVADGTRNWTALNVFSFDFFRDLYLGDADDVFWEAERECQFFPYQTEFQNLVEVLSMSPERAERPWYIGWSNCDSNIGNILREHYKRPYFLPPFSESTNIDWIFMGKPGYGAHMHIDHVNNPSWQAQIKGSKLWTLEPVPECYNECRTLETVVNPGEVIVLDTNRWYHKTLITGDELSITIGSEYD